MVTGLTIIAVMLAALNAWVAFLNYKSQATSGIRLNDMNEVLNKMEAIQRAINERELRGRKDRAQTALNTLTNALYRQVASLAGQWSGVSDKVDPLEPVRAFESELAWIPDCDWKTHCIEVFSNVRQQGSGARANREAILTGGYQQLKPGGEQRLYEACLKAIDHMI